MKNGEKYVYFQKSCTSINKNANAIQFFGGKKLTKIINGGFVYSLSLFFGTTRHCDVDHMGLGSGNRGCHGIRVLDRTRKTAKVRSKKSASFNLST